MRLASEARVVFLDYLRAIAAIMVLSVHWSGIGSGSQHSNNLLHLTTNLKDEHNFIAQGLSMLSRVFTFPPFDIRFASGGVLLFFLVSGFVIPMSVERSSFATFAIRRAARLLPPLWATIILWLLFNWALRQTGLADTQPFDITTVLANAFLVHDLFWRPHIDMSFWTLLIEVKFYLLIALMVILSKRITLGSIAGLVGFLLAITLPFFDSPESSDYETLFAKSHEDGRRWIFYFFRIVNNATPYIVYMLIGTVLFLWHNKRISAAQSAVAGAMLFVIFSTTFLIGPNGFAQIYYVEDGAKALTIFGIALLAERLGILKKSVPYLTKTLTFLGDISYPLYLTHGLIGMSLVYALWHFTSSLSLSLVLGGAGVICLSWALERLIGLPSIALGKKISTQFKVKPIVF